MFRLSLALAVIGTFATSAFTQKKTRLELLILANSDDDAKAIKDTKAFCAAPENQKAMEKSQKDGVPPPAPTAKYEIATYKGAKSVVTYRWVELAELEKRACNLDNAAENDAKRNKVWKEASKHRDRPTTLPFPHDPGPDGRLLQGALFFSRECKTSKLTPEERGKVKVEYFALVRNPEIDPRTGAADGVSSKHIVKVQGDKSFDKSPAVLVTVNPEGAKLLAALTRKNLRTNPEAATGIRRHLAIIVNGKVLAAPSINSVIAGAQFQISGAFTQNDIDALVEKLRPKQ